MEIRDSDSYNIKELKVTWRELGPFAREVRSDLGCTAYEARMLSYMAMLAQLRMDVGCDDGVSWSE